MPVPGPPRPPLVRPNLTPSMLYWLFDPLVSHFPGFYLFRFVTFRAAFAAILSFLIVVVCAPGVLAWLRQKRIGERQKHDSQKLSDLHAKKEGIPTMGGLLILLSVTISILLLGRLDCQRLDEAGVPLGLFPETEIRVGEAKLVPGDLLVLYSDGITERGAHYGEEFGEERLEQLVSTHREASLEQIRSHVLAAVTDWSAREAEDDMTLMLVRATTPGEAE